MEVIKICPAAFLLKVPQAGVAWVLNAWPDTAKFLIQQDLEINGIVYPDLRMQTDKGISCNLVEFPLMYALFNQGMYFRGEKPQLVGTSEQLELASESFRRGLYGYYNASEMEGCDLDQTEMENLMGEIEGLSPNGIQAADELLDLIELEPLDSRPNRQAATEYHGVYIWKEAVNVFGVEYNGEQLLIDCNLAEGENYIPPLNIDVKNVPYKLFQIIDTGEEDGFSPKSCMHTLIQWRDRIICIDLPMNMPYLLEKISVSHTEIDVVIFTHNHDDHIGELALLLQMDKKITVICPRIVWNSILLKAAAMFAMHVDELAEYFDYVPIRYGEEYDYAGLRILAHPSIHSVPCAMYRIRGIVDREWKCYGHMSDILNFQRCATLVEKGYLNPQRLAAYSDFLLAPATVKKIDVGARKGTEEFAVHGSWRDFLDDKSEHIVLAHTRLEHLEEEATVRVGQMAIAGSARDMEERGAHSYQDKYRERAIKYLGNYLFTLLGDKLEKDQVEREYILSYLRILADNEIRLIQPNTPFLKIGGQSDFVDLVVGGIGSLWVDREGEMVRIANVHVGDVIGDMGVLLQIPRTASVRADTYMYVLRIPGVLYREIALWLGIYAEGEESVLGKIWRIREIVQRSKLLGVEVPIYLQNKIAQGAEEIHLSQGEALWTDGCSDGALLIGEQDKAFSLVVNKSKIESEATIPPIFGESAFFSNQAERYDVHIEKGTTALKLDQRVFSWMRQVPVFKLRLRQLAERRAIYIHRALHAQ